MEVLRARSVINKQYKGENEKNNSKSGLGFLFQYQKKIKIFTQSRSSGQCSIASRMFVHVLRQYVRRSDVTSELQ